MKQENNFVDVTILNNIEENKKGNNPQRTEEFRDFAFGLFIHWSLDSLLGTVISHWMVGADEKLVKEFIEEYPKRFNPKYFDADEIMTVAQQAGMKYMSFGTKHHNGFCMFDTKSTPFNIMNTPFKRDVFKELCEAARKRNIVPGGYFSPWDFLWNYQNNVEINMTRHCSPLTNPGLMKYNQTQLKELLNNYGELGTMFFDGDPDGLNEIVWKNQPECVVTRGVMLTPENKVLNEIHDEAWETCHALSDSWSYKPYDDVPKNPLDIIMLLIKTRACGGNLLLNVPIDPFGRIPQNQIEVLQRVGTFVFFNQEAIYNVRPWKVANEGEKIWYTKNKDENTVYAFICTNDWGVGFDYHNSGEIRRNVRLTGVKATADSQIEIVGQSGKSMEHLKDIDLKAYWRHDEYGLYINLLQALRPLEERKWNYPLVIKITNAE